MGAPPDSLLFAYLEQFKSQLDRIEDDMDRADSRFERLRTVHAALENRVTALETWNTTRDQETTTSRWWIGAILGGLALLVEILVLAFGH